MPSIGDKYIKGRKTVEITKVTSKEVTYYIHPNVGSVTVSVAEFAELERKSFENGTTVERVERVEASRDVEDY